MVLVITGVFAAIFLLTHKDEPPPFGGMVEMAGGGGGNPEGDSHARGVGNPLAGPRAEAGAENKKPEPPTEQPKTDVKFEQVAVARDSFPELKDDPAAEEVFASPTEALKRLEKIKKLRDARKKVSAEAPAAAEEAPAAAVTPATV